MYKVTIFSRDGDHFEKFFNELSDAYVELEKAEKYYKEGGFQRQNNDCIEDPKPPLIFEVTLAKHVYGNLRCRVSLTIEDTKNYNEAENKTPW